MVEIVEQFGHLPVAFCGLISGDTTYGTRYAQVKAALEDGSPLSADLGVLKFPATIFRRDQRHPRQHLRAIACRLCRTAESWSRDASDEIAAELTQACADRSEIDPSIAASYFGGCDSSEFIQSSK